MFKLLREMRRRRLFRTAIIYLIASWVIVQVLDLAFEAFGVQEQALRFVFIGALLGFPLAMLFSWLYDITPEGVVRTRPARPDESQDLNPNRKDYVLLTGLLIVVGAVSYGLIEQILERDLATPAADVSEQEIPARSVAVLPFSEISATEDSAAFLAKGIHSDLLTSLSKVHDIKVISSTSVERYRETDKSANEIGRELRVATIMDGDVLRASDQVRINVQLVDTRTDETLWAESFDRDLTTANIFEMQSDIATAIVTHLKATLTPEEQAQIEVVQTENLDAYAAYVLGKERLARRMPAELEEAVIYFDEATIIDPTYALAFVGKNDACRLLEVYGSNVMSEICLPAKTLLARALELDPMLGEAYTGLAWDLWQSGEFDEAEIAFGRAMELSPNYPQTYHWYAGLIKWLPGRLDEAIALRKKALELDPLSLVILIGMAVDELDVGNFDAALRHVKRTIEIDPEFSRGYSWIAGIYSMAYGQPEVAIRWLQQAMEMNPQSSWYKTSTGLNYLDLGDYESAKENIEAGFSRAPDQLAAICSMMVLKIYAEQTNEIVSYARNCLQLSEKAGTYKFLWQGLALTALRDADLKNSEPDAALVRYKELFPELFAGPVPGLQRSNMLAAVDAAGVLQRAGREDEARVLLVTALEFIQDVPRLGMNGYQIKDAEIHALLGNTEEALAALNEAIEQGWRRFWWLVERNPNLNSIRDEPEFLTMMAAVEADMADRLRSLD